MKTLTIITRDRPAADGRHQLLRDELLIDDFRVAAADRHDGVLAVDAA